MIKVAALVVGRFIKRVVVGAVVDTVKVAVVAPAKAAVEEVKNVAIENVASEDGGVGKPDYVRIISTIAAVLFGVAYVLGYISNEQLKQLAQFLLLF